MAKPYKVVEGDCFSSLSVQFNFGDYHTLVQAQKGGFNTTRPNPNQLDPNDIVLIPEKKDKPAPGATTKINHYVVENKFVHLRLVLIDRADNLIKQKACDVLIGAKHFMGTTTDQGLLDIKNIPAKEKAAKLTLQLKAPPAPPAPAPAGPPPPANAIPPYPPPVKQEEFTDKEDNTYVGKDTAADHLICELKLGALPPHLVVAGVQQRLNNMGFNCGNENGADGKLTQAAVTAYQKRFKLSQTGKFMDIQAIIRAKHDDLGG